jgi:hypothetical protein
MKFIERRCLIPVQLIINCSLLIRIKQNPGTENIRGTWFESICPEVGKLSSVLN